MNAKQPMLFTEDELNPRPIADQPKVGTTDLVLDEGAASTTIEDLIEAVGVDATRRLCERLGGLSREIGAPSQLFINAIGHEAAVKLRDHLGRGHIYIPRRFLSRSARHKKVVALDGEGLTKQEIALRTGLSERRVYAILQAHREAG